MGEYADDEPLLQFSQGGSAQVLAVPAKVTDKGAVKVISAHTSDMIELISGVSKVLTLLHYFLHNVSGTPST